MFPGAAPPPPLDALAPALLLGAAIVAWNVLLVRRLAGAARGAAAALSSAASVAVPFLVTADAPLTRIVLAIFCVLLFSKSVDTGRGVADVAPALPLWRVLMWHAVPVSELVVGDAAARAATRREGLGRIARGLVLVGVVAALGALATVWDAPREVPAVRTAWMMCVFACLTPGACWLLLGAWMLTGVWMAHPFRAPFASRSVRDFWSRRWNLYFRDFSHRSIFLPLGGARRPVLGVLLVFAFSAAVHEFLVLAALGRTGGHMTAFFLLHGAAALGEGVLARVVGRGPWLPRPVAVGAHVVWFWATAPLFFAPLLEIVSPDRWRLW